MSDKINNKNELDIFDFIFYISKKINIILIALVLSILLMFIYIYLYQTKSYLTSSSIFYPSIDKIIMYNQINLKIKDLNDLNKIYRKKEYQDFISQFYQTDTVIDFKFDQGPSTPFEKHIYIDLSFIFNEFMRNLYSKDNYIEAKSNLKKINQYSDQDIDSIGPIIMKNLLNIKNEQDVSNVNDLFRGIELSVHHTSETDVAEKFLKEIYEIANRKTVKKNTNYNFSFN